MLRSYAGHDGIASISEIIRCSQQFSQNKRKLFIVSERPFFPLCTKVETRQGLSIGLCWLTVGRLKKDRGERVGEIGKTAASNSKTADIEMIYIHRS